MLRFTELIAGESATPSIQKLFSQLSSDYLRDHIKAELEDLHTRFDKCQIKISRQALTALINFFCRRMKQKAYK